MSFKISSARLSIYFTGLLFFELLDFLYFDSRSVLGLIFSFVFLFKLILSRLKFSIPQVVFLQAVALFSLIVNGSIIDDFFKSVYFLIALAVSALVLSVRKVDDLQCVLSKRVSTQVYADNILRCAFLLLSIDSLMYYLGLREFSINPNQLGIWSATYIAFGVLAKNTRGPITISNVNICFAAIALFASASKGALILIALPAIIFSLLKFSSKSVGVVSILFLASIVYVYGDFDSLEDKIQLLVELKDDYIGGSGQSSDRLRLFEIPYLVAEQFTDLKSYIFGVGLNHTTSDGLYQQIIPHNTFFWLLSGVGLSVTISVYFLVIISIISNPSRAVAALIAPCLLYVGLTGTPQFSRGALYSATLLLFACVLNCNNFNKNDSD